MANTLPIVSVRPKTGPNSRNVLRTNAANELVVAVVGHVGSGTSTVCELLKGALELQEFDVVILKASSAIRDWGTRTNKNVPDKDVHDLRYAQRLQDLGDQMRLESGDNAAVAKSLVQKIRTTRAAKLGQELKSGDAAVPDGTRRAYILDSVRHPAEVFLLRNLYQTAFAMIGVVSDEESRIDRLTKKFENAGEAAARAFMQRDRKATESHGQRVEEAFHLSDYFLDNSAPRWKRDKKPNPDWTLPDQLSRFIKIVAYSEIVRPDIAETAMYAAAGAQRRSACLSRQVGAALVDRRGNLVATGTNEVPEAGGGVYGQAFERAPDQRCAYRESKFCSNTREQNYIREQIIETVESFLKDIPEFMRLEVPLEQILAEHRPNLEERLRRSRIGELLEFSRAVHAEMDAVLSAARTSVSLVGARMFVTTFPCHYCARHLVSAGIDEVQYIEPYPKSKALSLHEDSITVFPEQWEPPSRGGSKVLFRPFTGVAPRLYSRAFLKDRELKDPITGDLRIGDPDWGTPWDMTRLSYVQLEAELSKEG